MNGRKRTLALRQETLSELVPGDLRVVAGGSAGPTCATCVTNCDYVCGTLLAGCIALESTVCHSAPLCQGGNA